MIRKEKKEEHLNIEIHIKDKISKMTTLITLINRGVDPPLTKQIEIMNLGGQKNSVPYVGKK